MRRALIWHVAAAVVLLSEACQAFDITSFDTKITIQKDSSYTIKETITVDFLNETGKHGIYRLIRISGKDRYGGNRVIRVQVLSVTNGYGGAWDFKVMPYGHYKKVRIGNPGVTVSGRQTYVITYRVRNGMLFFPDHDELYWNATGEEWPARIVKATATVSLPDSVNVNNIQANAFVGAHGSREQGFARVLNNRTVFFQSPRELSFNEGMTIAVGWPKGLIQPPGTLIKLWWFVSSNLFAFVPVAYFIGFVFLWRSTGRDEDPGVSVAVRYEPPDRLRPAEVGTLIDEKVDLSDITSTIVDLAVRGYLKISEQKEEGFLGLLNSRSYALEKVVNRAKEDPMGGLSSFEEKIYEKLFAQGDVINTNNLKNSFYTVVPKVKSDLYSSLVTKKYFRSNPESVRNGYVGLGISLIFFGGIVSVILFGSFQEGNTSIAPGWGLALLACGVITLLFAKLMPKKTRAGRKAYVDIKGFSEYLSRAEKHDLQLQEKKMLFEKFLPYAMALNVSEQWSKAFEGICSEPPDWYSGSALDRGFHPYVFVHSLNSGMRIMGSAMTSHPRSASSGGSSFGGGGFSGGGFGGGGGGSW